MKRCETETVICKKEHLYAKDFREICDKGFFLQLTMGRELSISYHNHDFYEIICVLSGSCKQIIGEEAWICETGDMVLLCPGDYHRLYDQIEKTNIAALSVSAEIMQTFLSAYAVCNRRAAVFLNTEELHQIRMYCTEAQMSTDIDYNKRVRLLLGQFIHCLTESEIKQQNPMPANFAQLLSKVSMPEVVAEGVPAFLRLSNYSFAHLCRLTKRYLGMTPGEYITSLRLKNAYEMIKWGSEQYEEIGEKVGFSSFSHFSKLIRQRYGMTPAQIRGQNKNNTRTV